MIFEATNCHRIYAVRSANMEFAFESAVIDFKDMPMGSVQVIWEGISGVLDGTFRFYASNIPDLFSFDPDGTEIDGSEIIPHNNLGSRIWIRDRLSFRYLLIRYSPGAITGGTCNIIALGKKS